jgi:hypothetical protein
LAAFAEDNQNVHRKETSEQTNKATSFLLSIKVPEGQRTERELTAAWMGMFGKIGKFTRYLNVINDIHKWFVTRTCRAEGDYLYQRVLRGLVAHINVSDHKDELWGRLWEECLDSVGMCCEGHISRLCNVLVGFVEGLDPPVSLGELLQQAMSAIANQDVPESEKRRLANQFFDERGVPEEERVAWLDAF